MQLSHVVIDFLRDKGVQKLIDKGDWKALYSKAAADLGVLNLAELAAIFKDSGLEDAGELYISIINEYLKAPDEVLTEHDLLLCKYDPVYYFLNNGSKAFSANINNMLKGIFGECRRRRDKGGNTIIKSASSGRIHTFKTLEEQSVFHVAVENADNWNDVFREMSDYYIRVREGV